MGWRSRRERDLERELKSHLDLEVEEQRERGLSALEAQYAAHRVVGNIPLVKERTRDMWGWNWIERLRQDVRYALRSFAGSPGFVTVALVSLALGIGATTALFSVVYGVLIAPYPYARPGEIWAPAVTSPKEPPRGWHVYTRREFLEIRKLPAFSSVMATAPGVALLSGDRSPENILAIQVSGNGFDFLGVKPVLGRTIQPFDINPGGEPAPVAVVSYAFWQRVLGAQPSAIGAKIVINDVPRTVIGVMPPRFGWYTSDGVWLPMTMNLADEGPLNVIMRLAAGVTPATATQILQSFNLQLAARTPRSFPREGFRSVLLNYLDITSVSDEMKSSLHLLFAAVGFLLLIACVNVANLQLARNTARVREIAVRLSIGASRSRIVRQLLTESVLLSVAGGIAGVLLAVGLTKAIVALIPADFLPNEVRIAINTSVLLFSFLISVATGILFGLAPAFQCSRPNLTATLKDGARGAGASVHGQRMRGTLVAAEVGLSVMLLAGASLAIRSFTELLRVNPGFQPERTLMLSVLLPPKQYKSIDRRNAFGRDLLERVKNLPGVEAAALGNGGMPFGGVPSAFTIDGRPGNPRQRIGIDLVSADYARTLGIPLKKGRVMTDDEIARGAHLALINETAAKLWPAGEDPVGRTITLDSLAKPGRGSALWPPDPVAEVTVVGILGDTRNAGLRDATTPGIFVPYTLIAPPGRNLAVRTHGDPTAMLNSIRSTVRDMDKQVPLGRPLSLSEVLGNETVQPRFTMALLACFAALGLALAAAGIYSVIACDVSQKVHEIGVRMALGADRSDVIGMVLGKSAKLAGIGLIVGIAGSIALERIAQFRFFGSAKLDWISVSEVVAVLAMVAFIASWAPARRAARMHPVDALRHEA
ncbi:MAG TPA: ABC transporter permease [Bryobacteraceae bacterium]|nr:ABC transporter permease [Bryobacteraceae bacterium]